MGREVARTSMALTETPFHLDVDRLTKHAVCFGMTGSGKTGLCVTLLEELNRAGIPLIVIDPKGDMANLMLAFKGLSAKEFTPWIDDAAARSKGLTSEELGAKTANQWREGLERWDIHQSDVSEYVTRSDIQVYTPGSHAGIPVNVLGALSVPSEAVVNDLDALTELATSTVSGLLSLAGLDVSPAVDPAHIVMSQVLLNAWHTGEDLDLESYILRIVDPSFERVGVFSVDTFFPKKDRMKLAMRLNGLIAAPSFGPWREGVALDIQQMLTPSNDKTPVRIFYLAHLNEQQRQFFSALLLSQIVAWSRQQPGTSRLRAMVYFDEVYGYLPPYPKNPPTKSAVLTLMKQARAVGVGTMLVTQNPVDIDYAALSNAGTWMVGRLQTPQDRARVIEGLIASDGTLQRSDMESLLGELPSRTFVVKSAGETEARLVHSRWAMSFLRGPLTLKEVQRLQPETTPERSNGQPPPPPPLGTFASSGLNQKREGQKSQVPEGWSEAYLDLTAGSYPKLRHLLHSLMLSSTSDGWRACIYVTAKMHFDEGRSFKMDVEEHRLVVDTGEEVAILDLDGPIHRVLDGPPPEVLAVWPARWSTKSQVKAITRRIKREILREETTMMYQHVPFKVVSRPNEAQEAFAVRVREEALRRADDAIAGMKAKLDREVSRWEEKRHRLQVELSQKRVDAQGQVATEVVSAAETLYGLFLGRRRSLASMATRRQQTVRAQGRVEKIESQIVDYELKLETARDAFLDEMEQIRDAQLSELGAISTIEVGLESDDIEISEISALWIPF